MRAAEAAARARTARIPRSLELAGFALVCACAAKSSTPGAALRVAPELAERPRGCIDTPLIAGGHRAEINGVECGRAASRDAVLLRGRVSTQLANGLPGAPLEGVWVTIHPIDPGASGPLGLEALPPARAEARTGPQGSFSISLAGAGEYVVAVRMDPGASPIAARRFEALPGERTPQLSLLVVLD